MCGIAGYFGTRTIDDARICRTLARMRRRGPDFAAHRHFVNAKGRHAYLLHSRLTILDLDARSNQPLSVGPKTIVYNGELYNFVEVRRALEERGERFTTSGDTEVVLRALVRDGVDALDRCEGMWALAAYDETDDSLLLSRDRFGEKPLYVLRGADGIYFGSEVKFIEALLDGPLEV